MRGQFRPEMTVGAGHGQCQDRRSDVVLGLTTLPLPPDREEGSSEHLFDSLLDFLTWHAEHLQLPITRCYLLLERSLRFAHQRRAGDVDPRGQQLGQGRREPCHRDLLGRCGPETDVQILAVRLAARGQGQAETDERVGDEPL